MLSTPLVIYVWANLTLQKANRVLLLPTESTNSLYFAFFWRFWWWLQCDWPFLRPDQPPAFDLLFRRLHGVPEVAALIAAPPSCATAARCHACFYDNDLVGRCAARICALFWISSFAHCYKPIACLRPLLFCSLAMAPQAAQEQFGQMGAASVGTASNGGSSS